MRFSLLQERDALFKYPISAPIAQLVEQLISNQWVGSSSLSGGTIVFKGLAVKRWAFCFYQRDVCVQIKPISEILVSPRLVVRKSLSRILTDFNLILLRFHCNCAFRNWFAASISA